ncbi:GAF domain-containing sensor histidine kinase [Richelia sinica]|nr:GAF domain-containing sensor histidine kinase [Richelia sinica]MBD2664835.1 GAF domain-containing sensor histidine kinase [Richelia sinica FACHB-800]
MLISPELGFSRTLPLSVFNQLRELLEQMAQAVENVTVVLTEAVLARICLPLEWERQKFTLVVSEQFSALLLGKQEDGGENGEENGEKPGESRIVSKNKEIQHLLLNTTLTFNAEAIASFISKLKNCFDIYSSTYHSLENYKQIIRTNDSTKQSQFTLLLLEHFLPSVKPSTTVNEQVVNTDCDACAEIEAALNKKIAQEQLLNQVTTQIRKSLDLGVIMATALTQVREFLGLDRLVIYQFEPAKVKYPFQLHKTGEYSSIAPIEPKNTGYVLYEARATEAIPSVLNVPTDECVDKNDRCWDKYRCGFTLVVDDVEKTYGLETCFLEFLQKNQIRAKLATPIMFEQTLWGLLIAHQCHAPHQWTDNEKSLLNAIAEQLAIAIHQTELMRSLGDAARKLTKEKQTLEQRVVERTIALREALLAAEAASRLRNEFLATISHELLTPLTYVIGMSSTLLRWPLGELSQRQRDYLQTIHDSGEHLLEMINDILDLSQIEAGKTVLNISEFSLIEIAQETAEALREKAEHEKVTLKLDLQIHPPRDRFTADLGRVEQIIWNLVSNAIKFTPEDGVVTLRLWVEDDTAIFQVEDTGIGIPEEQLPRLFEKFQQLDTPYRRRYEGTGLGLALTKQLVELHRGRIEVESTVGIGSIFTIWIPNQLKIKN